MARTAIPVTALVVNASTAISTTVIDQANGMNLALKSTAIPAKAESENLVLVVDNTAAGAHNFILRAGASNPPAFRTDLGDLTISVGATTTVYIGPFDWARFCQTDGSLNIDFDAGTTGTIQALLVPRTTN